MSTRFINHILACWLFCITATALAADPVVIDHAWARATAPGQEVGAAYMELKSSEDCILTKVETPVAGSVEIHKMSMKDGVMGMRMLEALDLPAGQTVKLEPGGFHLMLFDLKSPLKTGGSVPATLHFKTKNGKTLMLKTVLPILRNQD